jgi:hypothetical protein
MVFYFQKVFRHSPAKRAENHQTLSHSSHQHDKQTRQLLKCKYTTLQLNPSAEYSLFCPLLPQPNSSPQSYHSHWVSQVTSLAKGAEHSQNTGLNLGDKNETDVSEEPAVGAFKAGKDAAGSSNTLAGSTYQPNDTALRSRR